MLNKARNFLRKIKYLTEKYIVVSMGENCLTDDILCRNGLKSFSSPFSYGRSNIEYILAFEKEKYVATINQYCDASMNGMEFTHHDVINDTEKREQIARRCKRLQNISNKNVVFVYHNRYCRETNMDLLISCFEEVKRIYEMRNNHVQIFIFTQDRVFLKEDRKVERKETGSVRIYTFYTQNIWEGENQDIFWGRCDDDLLQVMIRLVRKLNVDD